MLPKFIKSIKEKSQEYIHHTLLDHQLVQYFFIYRSQSRAITASKASFQQTKIWSKQFDTYSCTNFFQPRFDLQEAIPCHSYRIKGCMATFTSECLFSAIFSPQLILREFADLYLRIFVIGKPYSPVVVCFLQAGRVWTWASYDASIVLEEGPRFYPSALQDDLADNTLLQRRISFCFQFSITKLSFGQLVVSTSFISSIIFSDFDFFLFSEKLSTGFSEAFNGSFLEDGADQQGCKFSLSILLAWGVDPWGGSDGESVSTGVPSVWWGKGGPS